MSSPTLTSHPTPCGIHGEPPQWGSTPSPSPVIYSPHPAASVVSAELLRRVCTPIFEQMLQTIAQVVQSEVEQQFFTQPSHEAADRLANDQSGAGFGGGSASTGCPPFGSLFHNLNPSNRGGLQAKTGIRSEQDMVHRPPGQSSDSSNPPSLRATPPTQHRHPNARDPKLGQRLGPHDPQYPALLSEKGPAPAPIGTPKPSPSLPKVSPYSDDDEKAKNDCEFELSVEVGKDDAIRTQASPLGNNRVPDHPESGGTYLTTRSPNAVHTGAFFKDGIPSKGSPVSRDCHPMYIEWAKKNPGRQRWADARSPEASPMPAQVYLPDEIDRHRPASSAISPSTALEEGDAEDGDDLSADARPDGADNEDADDGEKSLMVCKHWKGKGYCRLEANCKFQHPLHMQREGQKTPKKAARQRRKVSGSGMTPPSGAGMPPNTGSASNMQALGPGSTGGGGGPAQTAPFFGRVA